MLHNENFESEIITDIDLLKIEWEILKDYIEFQSHNVISQRIRCHENLGLSYHLWVKTRGSTLSKIVNVNTREQREETTGL